MLLGDDAGGHDMLAEIIAMQPEVVPQSICPNCHASLGAGSILCVNCGHDLRSGRALSTAMVAAPRVRREGAVWPIVIGVLCLLGGGLDLLDRVVTIADASDGGSSGFPTQALAGIIWTALLLIGGVQLLMRRSQAVKLLNIWAGVVTVFGLLAMTCLGAAVGGSEMMRDAFSKRFQIEEEGATLTVVLAIMLVLTGMKVAWAIFLLVWFKRDAIQQQVKSW